MKQAIPVHRRDVIIEAASSWLNQYRHEPADKVTGWNAKKTFGEIRSALKSLDTKTCTAEDLHRAMGMKGGWGLNNCDECGMDVPVLLRLGMQPDYDARYWDLCQNCLERAAVVLKDVEAKP